MRSVSTSPPTKNIDLVPRPVTVDRPSSEASLWIDRRQLDSYRSSKTKTPSTLWCPEPPSSFFPRAVLPNRKPDIPRLILFSYLILHSLPCFVWYPDHTTIRPDGAPKPILVMDIHLSNPTHSRNSTRSVRSTSCYCPALDSPRGPRRRESCSSVPSSRSRWRSTLPHFSRYLAFPHRMPERER